VTATVTSSAVEPEPTLEVTKGPRTELAVEEHVVDENLLLCRRRDG
jgi:hypothetical protein